MGRIDETDTKLVKRFKNWQRPKLNFHRRSRSLMTRLRKRRGFWIVRACKWKSANHSEDLQDGQSKLVEVISKIQDNVV